MTDGPVPAPEPVPDQAVQHQAVHHHAVQPTLEQVELPVTGDVRVDAALGRLGEFDDLPVEEHPAVFEDVHGRLQDALAHPAEE